MGAATALPVRDVRVEPGATTTATMLVRNTGQVVDQFTLDVVGAAVEWTTVEPKVVNLLPGSDVQVTITFAPERSPKSAAGVVPFGVRVISREDPPGSTVAEGSVEVGAFDDVQVELVPRQSKGRRKGRHQIAIDNHGNRPTTVEVTAQDEEEALDFAFDHRVASIEPGAAAFIRLTARPEKRFFKGADRQHPFVVTVNPADSAAVATRGTLTQRQLLPAWLIPAVAIVAALAVAGFVLYQTLLKPSIKSTAQDEAKKAASSANKSLASQASSAQAAAAAANKQAAAAKSDASKAVESASAAAKGKGGAGASSSDTGSGTGPGGVSLAGGTATAFPVNTSDPATPNDYTTFTPTAGMKIPGNKYFVLTYVDIQNPDGDTGTLSIQRGSGENLLTEGLATFRDIDHTFQAVPILFQSSDPLRVVVNCQKGGAKNSTACHPSVLVIGRMINKKSA